MSGITAAGDVRQVSRAVRVRQVRVAWSEWTKFFTLRSTRWSLVMGALLPVPLSVAFAAVTSSRWGTMSDSARSNRHPLAGALAGATIGQAL